jgi:hypothetical protein
MLIFGIEGVLYMATDHAYKREYVAIVMVLKFPR